MLSWRLTLLFRKPMQEEEEEEEEGEEEEEEAPQRVVKRRRTLRSGWRVQWLPMVRISSELPRLLK